jgi:hypothetical protein
VGGDRSHALRLPQPGRRALAATEARRQRARQRADSQRLRSRWPAKSTASSSVS